MLWFVVLGPLPKKNIFVFKLFVKWKGGNEEDLFYKSLYFKQGRQMSNSKIKVNLSSLKSVNKKNLSLSDTTLLWHAS